jgi:4-carboxymuconolactone decarboxylase
MPPPSDSSNPTPTFDAARATLFEAGTSIRTEVMSPAYVSRSLSLPSFSQPMQQLAIEAGWGLIWNRPGLDRRTRSLICIALLTTLGRNTELGNHVKGAIRNGCSEEEIQEVLLQVGAYAGLPAGLEGTRVAAKALEEMKAEEKK